MRTAQRLWQGSATLPGVRRVRQSETVMRTTQALRYGLNVRSNVRFAAREIRRRGDLHTYQLRESDLSVCLRHDDHDAYVLEEVFGRRFYSFPEPVRALVEASGGAPRVVDLGGHIGLFGLFVLSRYPGARIASFEPDPANAPILAQCIAQNAPSGNWQLVEACAGTAEGTVAFAGGLGERSHVAEPDSGGTQVPVIDALPYLEDAVLVKMDIEGAEWALLSDPRFARARPPALVLEYHSAGAPMPAEPRRSATDLLEGLGYEVEPIPGTAPSEEVGMLWAWQPGA